MKSGLVSLKPPFFPLVIAERMADTMTTSSSCFSRRRWYAEEDWVAIAGVGEEGGIDLAFMTKTGVGPKSHVICFSGFACRISTHNALFHSHARTMIQEFLLAKVADEGLCKVYDADIRKLIKPL